MDFFSSDSLANRRKKEGFINDPKHVMSESRIEDSKNGDHAQNNEESKNISISESKQEINEKQSNDVNNEDASEHASNELGENEEYKS